MIFCLCAQVKIQLMMFPALYSILSLVEGALGVAAYHLHKRVKCSKGPKDECLVINTSMTELATAAELESLSLKT